jgi:23S rRNA (adenine2503-C2)-methyltransferase
MNTPLAYDLSFEDWVAVFAGWNEPRYRARQIWSQLYRRLAPAPDSMVDLPAGLRQKLADSFDFSGVRPHIERTSSDGTTEKTLFRLADQREVETVLMRYDQRRTVCISTQAGCGMGCPFCATGQMGFLRHLTSGEIVAQVLHFARRLAGSGERITNIVVMGMGEPFHNYDATLAALDRLHDSDGFGFAARRSTISTVGLVPMIERFTAERRQINLAVSLHAATDELRSKMIPINRRYPLPVLREACRKYTETSRRRLTLEWALIEGVNDGQDQAEALAAWARGMLCHVNVIPLNPTRGYAGQPSSHHRVAAFREVVERGGLSCTIRVRRGLDIQAGCGQLATESQAALAV